MRIIDGLIFLPPLGMIFIKNKKKGMSLARIRFMPFNMRSLFQRRIGAPYS